MEIKKIKEELLQNCFDYVDARIATLRQIIKSNQQALLSETKSSAGDKHETGRAMIQLEIEKASQQFASIEQMREILQKTEIYSNTKVVKLGSLIYTNQETYFLAVSIGLIRIDDINVFVVSPSSPIGKLLLGKIKGDAFILNKLCNKILKIV